MKKIKAVGYLTKEMIDLAGSDLPSQEIIITEEVQKHIKKEHPEDYDKYFISLESIINNPDYVGINEKHRLSMEFIKKIDNNILVAVKLSIQNEIYVASMYHINDLKISKRLNNKTIKPIVKK
jgi:hypothetical protein